MTNGNARKKFHKRPFSRQAVTKMQIYPSKEKIPRILLVAVGNFWAISCVFLYWMFDGSPILYLYILGGFIFFTLGILALFMKSTNKSKKAR